MAGPRTDLPQAPHTVRSSVLDVLAHVPLPRRIGAVAAIGLGRAIAAAARTGSSDDDRDVLVAFATLGDQLRMLNALSRYAPPDRPLDVACNAEAAAAFALYRGIGARRAYGMQGAAALGAAAVGLLRRHKPYRRAIVAHPFITQPIALAYARTCAAHVTAFESAGFAPRDCRPGDVAVPLGSTSWRDAYEALFRASYGESNASHPMLAPAVAADCARERESARSRPPVAVVHVNASTPARSLPRRLSLEVIRGLRARGYHVSILGSRAEREDLTRAFASSGATLTCGAPLRDVVALVAAARVFLGVDSSMLHVADAVGTPSVIVYLATQPSVTGPFYTSYAAVYPRAGYRPVGVDALTRWNDCPAVGSDVEVGDVFDAFDRVAAR